MNIDYASLIFTTYLVFVFVAVIKEERSCGGSVAKAIGMAIATTIGLIAFVAIIIGMRQLTEMSTAAIIASSPNAALFAVVFCGFGIIMGLLWLLAMKARRPARLLGSS